MGAAFFVGFTCTAAFNLLYLYTGETFPTTMRQSAIGTCSIFARMGSIIAPFMREVTLATHLSVSMTLFAILAAISAFVALFLSETRGKEMPETVGDTINGQVEVVENFKKKERQ